MADATERFANRVENYVRYRPRYPKEILERLELECGLGSESVIADLGSGTGFLAELFLANGNRVFGIEPNAEMRAAGERRNRLPCRTQAWISSRQGKRFTGSIANAAA